MLGDSVASFAWKARERVRRSNVDDGLTSNLSSTTTAGPSLRCLLAHCCHLSLHAEKVSSGGDIDNAVEVLDIGVRQSCMHAAVDLYDRYHALARYSSYPDQVI